MMLFGILIGVLTGLSTAVGTTSTLIGLLFALIGGSLMGWYNNTTLTATQLLDIKTTVKEISIGMLVGLCCAFAFRGVDAKLIQPSLASGPNQDPALRQQVDTQARVHTLLRLLIENETTNFKPGAAPSSEDLQRISTIMEIARGVSTSGLPATTPAVTTNSFVSLQSAHSQQFPALTRALDDLAQVTDPALDVDYLRQMKDLLTSIKQFDSDSENFIKLEGLLKEKMHNAAIEELESLKTIQKPAK